MIRTGEDAAIKRIVKAGQSWKIQVRKSIRWWVRQAMSFALMLSCPHNFIPARRGSASVEPIMRLMGGMLADAVRSFQRNFGCDESEQATGIQGSPDLDFPYAKTMGLSLSRTSAKPWISIHVACGN